MMKAVRIEKGSGTVDGGRDGALRFTGDALCDGLLITGSPFRETRFQLCAGRGLYCSGYCYSSFILPYMCGKSSFLSSILPYDEFGRFSEQYTRWYSRSLRDGS